MPQAEINGFNMHYEDVGTGDVIVFQHAWLSSSMVWGGVVPLLSDRYRCITVDGRGAGESERTEEGHTNQQYGQDLLALTTELGIDRFAIAGHSSGGFAAVEASLAAPERVSALLLVGSFVDADYLAPGFADQLVGIGELVASDDAAARPTLEGFFASACARCEPEMIAGAIDLAMSGSPGFSRGAIQSVADTRRGDSVSEITTPALVVSGSADAFLPACITASQRLADAALHVFNRVGHMIPAEVPDGLADVIDDFLQHGAVTAEKLAAAAAG